MRKIKVINFSLWNPEQRETVLSNVSCGSSNMNIQRMKKTKQKSSKNAYRKNMSVYENKLCKKNTISYNISL